MYSLYSLNDPITKEVRYIGYTSKTLKERLSSHWGGRNFKKRSYKLNWFKQLESRGLKPTIHLITTSDDLDSILELEKYYISLYDNLTNSTSGGEISKTYLPEVVAKMKANRGDCSGENNPMYGKKRPDLSKRNLQNVFTEEQIEKIRQKALKRNEDPEYKKQHIYNQKTRKEVKAICFKTNTIKGTYPSINNMCKILNLDSKSVNCVIKGIYKQHKGYKFELTNDKN